MEVRYLNVWHGFFCVYSCCVLCVKYARVQNKSARRRQRQIRIVFFQFCTQITVKNRSSSKLFVFPMKNGTRMYIQMIFWHSLGGSKHANYKIAFFANFVNFARKSLWKKGVRPNFSCFPWKMGQECVFRWFSVIHVGGANIANYEISKFCHFHTQTTVRGRKESGGFVFPSKNGARLYIQMLL